MNQAAGSSSTATARSVVVDALTQAAAHFPDMMPGALDTSALSPQDARLAEAIHRTVLQRWVTLQYLLDRHLNQPLGRLEPALAGILLSGAAQIVLMQRVPTFAAVDEAVTLAKQRLRKRAGGLVNAVLRKLADDVAAHEPETTWQHSADQLPLAHGRVTLREPMLPDPSDAARYLAVATSYAEPLVKHWLNQLGQPRTAALCHHGVTHPPTIVAVEDAFDRMQTTSDWRAHDHPGFIVWRGSYQALVAFLQAHPARRVQDPAAALAVQSTATLSAHSALDLCAGRGTKTRQLAVTHPQARIVATDSNPQRVADLSHLTTQHSTIEPVAFDAVPNGPFDLIVLDVPCSNTGVLARRAEARYRFSQKKRRTLLDQQRQIIRRALPMVAGGGYLLYTTCSIDRAENEQQTEWVEQTAGAEVVAERRWLPGGEASSYHDGSYHALLRLPE